MIKKGFCRRLFCQQGGAFRVKKATSGGELCHIEYGQLSQRGKAARPALVPRHMEADLFCLPVPHQCLIKRGASAHLGSPLSAKDSD